MKINSITQSQELSSRLIQNKQNKKTVDSSNFLKNFDNNMIASHKTSIDDNFLNIIKHKESYNLKMPANLTNTYFKSPIKKDEILLNRNNNNFDDTFNLTEISNNKDIYRTTEQMKYSEDEKELNIIQDNPIKFPIIKENKFMNKFNISKQEDQKYQHSTNKVNEEDDEYNNIKIKIENEDGEGDDVGNYSDSETESAKDDLYNIDLLDNQLQEENFSNQINQINQMNINMNRLSDNTNVKKMNLTKMGIVKPDFLIEEDENTEYFNIQNDLDDD